ncbi:MAG: hypothetical protein ABI136_05145, partial [Ginsengibacter sp.]
WHSAKTLNRSVFDIIPLKKIFLKFVALLALYSILFLAISKVETKIKLMIAVISTILIIMSGLIKYLKPIFKKEII